MTSRSSLSRAITRLASMDHRELAWRSAAAARIARDRALTAMVPARWRRSDLGALLDGRAEIAGLREAIRSRNWRAAHQSLSAYFADATPRFVIAPRLRAETVRRIEHRFVDAGAKAIARADRLVAGEYDLLGYRGLRFDSSHASGDRSSLPDWHYDPVHRRRAPRGFWSTVPFLDPACGDHKIIWELNRHQHWMALGRAAWLSGDGRYRARVLAELTGWLDQNPPLLGINWASMLELAFRSLSWVWAVHFFADPAADDAEPWLVDLLVALDQQLAHVHRNLSYYFSPNTHLLGEALALYVSGSALPFLKASSGRAAAGRRVLLAELDRQISPDGGHCERSTHYHRYALDFYEMALAVARITGDDCAARFAHAVARLGSAACLLADDRGRLPHIGDDDGGAMLALTDRPVDEVRDSLAIAAALVKRADMKIGGVPEECYWLLAHPRFTASVDDLAAAADREPMGSGALPDTGYFVSRSPAGDHLVVDAGPHGYQNAGHAHADALSLTASLRGIPLLIDTGTASYTADPTLRDRFRSTAAHNTLTIDERPQSVPSGPFHWAHEARTVVHRWRSNSGFDYLEASHDGYGPQVHVRHVLAIHGDLVIVADLVAGEGLHRADAHWHIDPRWQVAASGRRAVLSCPGERVELVASHGVMETFCGDEQTGLGWHSPVYGRCEPATTIRVSYTASAPMWIVSVFGFDRDNPIADVDAVPVWAEAGALQESVAVRIERRSSTDAFLVADGRQGSIWRVGEFETDARVLFCRHDAAGRAWRAALVDGTFARTAGRRRFALTLGRQVPDVHVDVAPGRQGDAVGVEARVSGPAFAARVEVAGRDVPIAAERRSTARTQTRQLEVR